MLCFIGMIMSRIAKQPINLPEKLILMMMINLGL